MKKTLNLLLGLSLMASAYAKSPVVKPTIASLPPAPISPTGSIALQDGPYPYAFIYYYEQSDVTPVSGTEDSLYPLTIVFGYDVGLQVYYVTPNVSFTLTNIDLGGEYTDVNLDWPAGQASYSTTLELPGPPQQVVPATVSPTTYTDTYGYSHTLLQGICSLAYASN